MSKKGNGNGKGNSNGKGNGKGNSKGNGKGNGNSYGKGDGFPALVWWLAVGVEDFLVAYGVAVALLQGAEDYCRKDGQDA